jgi:competence protein ComEC
MAAIERRPQLALIGALSAALFVGASVRFEPASEPAGIALHNATNEVAVETRFRALVADEPDVRGRSQRVRLDVRDVFFAGEWVESSGGVLMRTTLRPEYEYGDMLEVWGQLETPPSSPDFDYREYLARQGVISVIDFPSTRRIASDEGNLVMAAVHSARRSFGDALERALPEPQAALAQGILLGQRTSMPDELTSDLNATGTSHLVAVSGQNVALIAGLTIGALAWLIGRRRAAIVALAVIAGYTMLTGASPPVVRAAIMGGLFVIAEMSGRPTSALVLILLAAAIMTGLDPLIVEDVSFQLSFAAIIGLVYLTPLLHARGAEGLRARGIDPVENAVAFLLGSTAVTMGAILATLPITALNFHRVSAVAPLANLVVVPAFPLILVTSAITAFAGAVGQPLGAVAGWVAWAPLAFMIESVQFFARLPLASFEIDDFTSFHAVAAYAGLVALALWLARQRVVTPLITSEPTLVVAPQVRPVWMLAGGLAIAASLAWWTALDASEERLTVSFLDVGQGDAVLIETPSGQQILVDGGPDGQRLVEALSVELAFWDRSLDAVVLTHAQEDHVAGLLEALDRYEVELAIGPALASQDANDRAWSDAVEDGRILYRRATPGDAIDLGDGAVLRVLAPDDAALASGEPNDASVVLKISLGEVDFLLTGDIEEAGERALLASGENIEADVLKVAHHGSSTSTTPPFVAAVDAEIAIISAGADNRFGHPAAQTLERLAGTSTFRTDVHGTISVSTDGERAWIERERE